MTTDQENADIAQQMIIKLINENKQIESRIWASAIISTFVLAYKTSGFPFSEVRKDMETALDFYEEIWDKENT